jgi:hypothetical protein
MPVGKNFKKGRSNLKKKNNAIPVSITNKPSGVKLSHGKAGGNIKYTKKKPVKATGVVRERIKVGPKEIIEKRIKLPKDFKEGDHIRLEDELANLGSDSESNDEFSSDQEEIIHDEIPMTPEKPNKLDKPTKSNMKKKTLKLSKSKRNQKHIQYKKANKVNIHSDSDSDSESNEQDNNGSRLQLLADKMTDKHVQLSVQILHKIDPTQKMPKEDLINVLAELQDRSEDILFVETVGYLLESLENLEEKLEESKSSRRKQEKTLKAKRIDGKVFKHKISLDLASDEEPEPDENDRIFTTGKKIYSGKHKLYIKADKKQEREVARKIKPKKFNPKLQNKYRFID